MQRVSAEVKRETNSVSRVHEDMNFVDMVRGFPYSVRCYKNSSKPGVSFNTSSNANAGRCFTNFYMPA